MIEGLAHYSADADGGIVTQIYGYSRHGCKFGAQLLNDLVDLRALGAGLQINVYLALVEAPAARSDLRQHVGHVGIVLNNLGDLELVLQHGIIRRALDRFGGAIDLPDVLAGEEALGNRNRQIHSAYQQC